jgi:hypothetical protein
VLPEGRFAGPVEKLRATSRMNAAEEDPESLSVPVPAKVVEHSRGSHVEPSEVLALEQDIARELIEVRSEETGVFGPERANQRCARHALTERQDRNRSVHRCCSMLDHLRAEELGSRCSGATLGAKPRTAASPVDRRVSIAAKVAPNVPADTFVEQW